jgi:hypothetical protein
MFYLLLAGDGSGSLEVWGFLVHHTTRHCCPLLQYNKTMNYQNGIYKTSIFLAKCNTMWVIIGLEKPECEVLWYAKQNEKYAVPKCKCVPISLGIARTEEERNSFLHRMKGHCWMAPRIKWEHKLYSLDLSLATVLLCWSNTVPWKEFHFQSLQCDTVKREYNGVMYW